MITHILDIVFITPPHIFLSEIHLKFVWNFWSSDFLLVGGPLVGGRYIWSVVVWSVVGWSVAGWLVIGGLLAGGFKKTQTE